MRHLEKIQNLCRFTFRLAQIAGMHECSQHHVLQHSQTGKRLYDLKGASYAKAGGAMRRRSRNIFSLKENDSFIGMEKPADQVEHRGFTCSVRPDDEKDLARIRSEEHT